MEDRILRRRDAVLCFMILRVNGEELQTDRKTLMELLGELAIKKEAVAIEVNNIVIRKKDYDSFKLSDGDRVEIVNFVGGG